MSEHPERPKRGQQTAGPTQSRQALQSMHDHSRVELLIGHVSKAAQVKSIHAQIDRLLTDYSPVHDEALRDLSTSLTELESQ